MVWRGGIVKSEILDDDVSNGAEELTAEKKKMKQRQFFIPLSSNPM